MPEEVILPVAADVFRKVGGTKNLLHRSGRTLPLGAVVSVKPEERMVYQEAYVMAVPVRSSLLCGDDYFLLAKDLAP